MLDFLVKLATYLDDKGQHTIAQELDTIAETLARPNVKQAQENLSSVLSKVSTMAKIQAANTSLYPSKEAERMIEAIDAAWTDHNLPASVATAINNTLEGLNQIANKQYSADNPMSAIWDNVAKSAQNALDALQTKPTSKRKPNSLVMKIQQDMGIKATGYWDAATNARFLEMMNSQPKYAKYVVGGKFKGTLQDAARLISQLAELNTPDAPKQEAPTQQQPQWTSKHFQITPAAMKSLYEIEKYWPGTAQKEINSLDNQKETGSVGKHMDQEIFEEMLAGRARPA